MKTYINRATLNVITLITVALLTLTACGHKAGEDSVAATSGPLTKGALTKIGSADTVSVLMAATFKTAANDLDNNIVDKRVLLRRDSADSVWLYYQLNTGDDAKLYRQRIINLISVDAKTVKQDAYEPLDSSRWQDAWNKPTVMDNFSPQDIKPILNPGCTQIWTQLEGGVWRGYVDPTSCQIFSKRRQQPLYIEGESILTAKTLQQTERGFDTERKQLWGTKPGVFISLFKSEP